MLRTRPHDYLHTLLALSKLAREQQGDVPVIVTEELFYVSDCVSRQQLRVARLAASARVGRLCESGDARHAV